MSGQRVGVIVGGTSGIGREVARSLAVRGDQVLITGRDRGRAETIAAEIGGSVRGLALDLTRPDQAENYVRTLPIGALLLVLTAWTVATFCGGIVAAAIEKGRPRRAAAIVGVVVLVVTIANLVLIPHPLWFSIAGVVSIVVASLAAGRAMSSVPAH